MDNYPAVNRSSACPYNPAGSLQALENRLANGTLLSSFTGLMRDGVGNLSNLAATFAGVTAFGYSPKGQLTQEQSGRNGGYANAFLYDPAGNPTTFVNQAGRTFNANNQRSGAGFVYDGDGNPTNYFGAALFFDRQDRLRQVPAGYLGSNATRSFAYDAQGLRAWKQNGDATMGRTYYLYDGTDPVQESGDEYGRKTNTFGVNGLVARTSNGLNVYYLFDWQGNVAHRLDANGNVLDSSMYSAHGSRVTSACTATCAARPTGPAQVLSA